MSEERLRAIRAGRERMDYGEYIGLSSMVSVVTAAALSGGKARSDDLAAAAEALGVRHHSPQP